VICYGDWSTYGRLRDMSEARQYKLIPVYKIFLSLDGTKVLGCIGIACRGLPLPSPSALITINNLLRLMVSP